MMILMQGMISANFPPEYSQEKSYATCYNITTFQHSKFVERQDNKYG